MHGPEHHFLVPAVLLSSFWSRCPDDGVGRRIRFGSWGATLLILTIVGVALGYHIHVEETLLVSEFGDEYIQYSKQTKKLIPLLL
jgi:protein-S-isoprenylcysteine O-methyltransferase Ste14